MDTAMNFAIGFGAIIGAVGVGALACYFAHRMKFWRWLNQRVILLEDDATAAWMTLNNTFAGGGKGHVMIRDHWKGVLYQLGDFKDPEKDDSEPPVYYAGVRIEGRSFGVPWPGTWPAWSKSFPPQDPADPLKPVFYWFNVTVNGGGVGGGSGTPEPLEPDHALGLFPSATLTSCSEVQSQYEAVPELLRCFRNRMLHANLKPKALMTFWQGSQGYDVNVRTTQHQPKHNRVEFEFYKSMVIDVYKGVTDENGTVTSLTKIEPSFTTARRITVLWSPTGSDKGEKQDPPWP